MTSARIRTRERNYSETYKSIEIRILKEYILNFSILFRFLSVIYSCFLNRKHRIAIPAFTHHRILPGRGEDRSATGTREQDSVHDGRKLFLVYRPTYRFFGQFDRLFLFLVSDPLLERDIKSVHKSLLTEPPDLRKDSKEWINQAAGGIRTLDLRFTKPPLCH
jgi:hypothetical protein